MKFSLRQVGKKSSITFRIQIYNIYKFVIIMVNSRPHSFKSRRRLLEWIVYGCKAFVSRKIKDIRLCYLTFAIKHHTIASTDTVYHAQVSNENTNDRNNLGYRIYTPGPLRSWAL
jgi:hypothetical protein